MKQTLVIATLVVALTACGSDQKNQPASADKATQPTADATNAASDATLPGALPQGFALKFPNDFTSVTTATDKNGEQRRRFSLSSSMAT